MKPEIWTPHVTVAAIVERDGRFLVIEEHTSSGLRVNQPSGHLEAGETLVEAVARETLEETAHPFEPQALVGVYVAHYARPSSSGATYLRFAFCGRAGERIAHRALDDGIVRTLWLTADELRACEARHRSPAVMRCVDDYLAGRRVPLDFVHTHSVAPYRAAPDHQAVGK
ncbi:NUDIX hydrolase [Burkholderia pseudomallei]|uniref:NUDIX hydrolase n=1 Tax=Burkholderia pseudomallei TaxID=28450 RepID=UPI001AD79467|nr:NUDIX hydrolase [Burkholderia pseudomallei]MBO7863075.1 NUDIX hydrolase [Burkholderia pseudomallei]MBO7875931.1 NUDIX hydrolase [Burkholderia pseudomallei]